MFLCRDGKIPINKAGFFSYLLVTWMSKLIWKVFRHRNEQLNEEDIWTCPDEESANVNTERSAWIENYICRQTLYFCNK